MPKLKVLSGDEVIRILENFGFEILNHRGSHVKLRRMREGIKESLLVPRHKELDAGTLKAIFNQVSRYIAQEELRKFFYTD